MTLMKTYKKFISLLVAMCVIASSILVPPAKAEGGIENLPLSLMPLGIPQELASIKEAFLPDTKTENIPLIHIQSVHAHAETQKKIFALLKFLDEKYGVRALFIEGAGEKLNPDYFKFFDQNQLNVEVAQKLVEKGELTGAELFLIESQEKIPAYGIEDPDLYRDNLESFQIVMSRQNETNTFTKGLDGELDRLGTHLLTPHTRTLLRTNESFEAGQMELLSYAFELERRTKQILGVDLRNFESQKDWPQMIRLLRLQEAESGLDPERIQTDRQKLIADLKEIGVHPVLVHAFENLSFSPYQTGMVYDPGFNKNDLPRYLAEYLVVSTVDKGFSFDHYPYFTHYLEAAVLQSELDAERLFGEIERLFQNLIQAVAAQPEELKLVGLAQRGGLFERLFDLELTPKDYVKIQQAETIDRPLVRYLIDMQSLHDKTNLGPSQIIPANIRAIEYLYQQAMRFYQLAKKREDVMVEKILNPPSTVSSPPREEKSKMRENGVTVLITGGFHADGLSRAFRKKGISYTILSPRITEKTSSQDYISSLLGEKKTSFDVNYLEPAIKEISNAIRMRMTTRDQNVRPKIIIQEIKSVLQAIIETAKDERMAASRIIRAINQSSYASDRRFVLILSRTGEKAIVWDNVENKPLRNIYGAPIVIPFGTITVETPVLDARSAPTTQKEILADFELPGVINESSSAAPDISRSQTKTSSQSTLKKHPEELPSRYLSFQRLPSLVSIDAGKIIKPSTLMTNISNTTPILKNGGASVNTRLTTAEPTSTGINANSILPYSNLRSGVNKTYSPFAAMSVYPYSLKVNIFLTNKEIVFSRSEANLISDSRLLTSDRRGSEVHPNRLDSGTPPSSPERARAEVRASERTKDVAFVEAIQKLNLDIPENVQALHAIRNSIDINPYGMGDEKIEAFRKLPLPIIQSKGLKKRFEEELLLLKKIFPSLQKEFEDASYLGDPEKDAGKNHALFEAIIEEKNGAKLKEYLIDLFRKDPQTGRFINSSHIRFIRKWSSNFFVLDETKKSLLIPNFRRKGVEDFSIYIVEQFKKGLIEQAQSQDAFEKLAEDGFSKLALETLDKIASEKAIPNLNLLKKKIQKADQLARGANRSEARSEKNTGRFNEGVSSGVPGTSQSQTTSLSLQGSQISKSKQRPSQPLLSNVGDDASSGTVLNTFLQEGRREPTPIKYSQQLTSQPPFPLDSGGNIKNAKANPAKSPTTNAILTKILNWRKNPPATAAGTDSFQVSNNVRAATSRRSGEKISFMNRAPYALGSLAGVSFYINKYYNKNQTSRSEARSTQSEGLRSGPSVFDLSPSTTLGTEPSRRSEVHPNRLDSGTPPPSPERARAEMRADSHGTDEKRKLEMLRDNIKAKSGIPQKFHDRLNEDRLRLLYRSETLTVQELRRILEEKIKNQKGILGLTNDQLEKIVKIVGDLKGISSTQSTPAKLPKQLRFKVDPNLESIKQAISATIDWLIEQGYPHPEVLKNYKEAVKKAEPLPAELARQGMIYAKKKDDPSGTMTIRINDAHLYWRWNAIQNLDSLDYFFLGFASDIIREAWGGAAFKWSDPEHKELLKEGIPIIRNEAASLFEGNPQPFWPRDSVNRFLSKYDEQILRFVAILMANEFYETSRQEEAIKWGKEKGLFLPKRFQSSLRAAKGRDAQGLRALFEGRYEEILKAQGDPIRILEKEIQLGLGNFRAWASGLDNLTQRIYAFYFLSEFQRSIESQGKEGIDSKLQLSEAPPLEMFRSAAFRLHPEIQKIILSWQERTRADSRAEVPPADRPETPPSSPERARAEVRSEKNSGDVKLGVFGLTGVMAHRVPALGEVDRQAHRQGEYPDANGRDFKISHLVSSSLGIVTNPTNQDTNAMNRPTAANRQFTEPPARLPMPVTVEKYFETSSSILPDSSRRVRSFIKGEFNKDIFYSQEKFDLNKTTFLALPRAEVRAQPTPEPLEGGGETPEELRRLLDQSLIKLRGNLMEALKHHNNTGQRVSPEIVETIFREAGEAKSLIADLKNSMQNDPEKEAHLLQGLDYAVERLDDRLQDLKIAGGFEDNQGPRSEVRPNRLDSGTPPSSPERARAEMRNAETINDAGVSGGTARFQSKQQLQISEPKQRSEQTFQASSFFIKGQSATIIPNTKKLNVADRKNNLSQAFGILPNTPPTTAATKNAWNSVKEVFDIASNRFGVQNIFTSGLFSFHHTLAFQNGERVTNDLLKVNHNIIKDKITAPRSEARSTQPKGLRLGPSVFDLSPSTTLGTEPRRRSEVHPNRLDSGTPPSSPERARAEVRSDTKRERLEKIVAQQLEMRRGTFRPELWKPGKIVDFFLPYTDLDEQEIRRLVQTGLDQGQAISDSNFPLEENEQRALRSAVHSLVEAGTRGMVVTTLGPGKQGDELMETVETVIAELKTLKGKGQKIHLVLQVVNQSVEALLELEQVIKDRLLELPKTDRSRIDVEFKGIYGNLFDLPAHPEFIAPSHIFFWRNTWMGEHWTSETIKERARMIWERLKAPGVLILWEREITPNHESLEIQELKQTDLDPIPASLQSRSEARSTQSEGLRSGPSVFDLSPSTTLGTEPSRRSEVHPNRLDSGTPPSSPERARAEVRSKDNEVVQYVVQNYDTRTIKRALNFMKQRSYSPSIQEDEVIFRLLGELETHFGIVSRPSKINVLESARHYPQTGNGQSLTLETEKFRESGARAEVRPNRLDSGTPPSSPERARAEVRAKQDAVLDKEQMYEFFMKEGAEKFFARAVTALDAYPLHSQGEEINNRERSVRWLDDHGKPGALVEIKNADRLIVIGDLHGAYENLAAILKEVDIERALRKDKNAHLVITGDAIHTHRSELFEDPKAYADSFTTLLQILALKRRFPVQVHYLPGNHDYAHLPHEMGGLAIWQQKRLTTQNSFFEKEVFGEGKPFSEEALEGFKNYIQASPVVLKIHSEDDRTKILLAHAGAVHNIQSLKDVINFFTPEVRDLTRIPRSQKEQRQTNPLLETLWSRDYSERAIADYVEKNGVDFAIGGHTTTTMEQAISNNFSIVSLKERANLGWQNRFLIVDSTRYPIYLDLKLPIEGLRNAGDFSQPLLRKKLVDPQGNFAAKVANSTPKLLTPAGLFESDDPEARKGMSVGDAIKALQNRIKELLPVEKMAAFDYLKATETEYFRGGGYKVNRWTPDHLLFQAEDSPENQAGLEEQLKRFVLEFSPTGMKWRLYEIREPRKPPRFIADPVLDGLIDERDLETLSKMASQYKKENLPDEWKKTLEDRRLEFPPTKDELIRWFRSGDYSNILAIAGAVEIVFSPSRVKDAYAGIHKPSLHLEHFFVFDPIRRALEPMYDPHTDSRNFRSEARASDEELKQYLSKLWELAHREELIKSISEQSSGFGYEVKMLLNRVKLSPFSEKEVRPQDILFKAEKGDVLVGRILHLVETLQKVTEEGQVEITVPEGAKTQLETELYLVLGPNPEKPAETLLYSSKGEAQSIPSQLISSPYYHKVISTSERIPLIAPTHTKNIYETQLTAANGVEYKIQLQQLPSDKGEGGKIVVSNSVELEEGHGFYWNLTVEPDKNEVTLIESEKTAGGESTLTYSFTHPETNPEYKDPQSVLARFSSELMRYASALNTASQKEDVPNEEAKHFLFSTALFIRNLLEKGLPGQGENPNRSEMRSEVWSLTEPLARFDRNYKDLIDFLTTLEPRTELIEKLLRLKGELTPEDARKFYFQNVQGGKYEKENPVAVLTDNKSFADIANNVPLPSEYIKMFRVKSQPLTPAMEELIETLAGRIFALHLLKEQDRASLENLFRQPPQVPPTPPDTEAGRSEMRISPKTEVLTLSLMERAVKHRPYSNPKMDPKTVVRAILEIAKQMRWVFSPDDEEILPALIEFSKQSERPETESIQFNSEIARIFTLLAKGANQPGVHVATLDYVPSTSELRGLIVPLVENKKARVSIFVTPEAVKNQQDQDELTKQMDELTKLVPDGRANLVYAPDWIGLRKEVLKAAHEAHKQYFPEGEVKFQTFLGRYFVLSLPENLSDKIAEFGEDFGKSLRSVTYSIPEAKRAAYLVIMSGASTKLAQDVLSLSQKQDLFEINGSRFKIKSSAFALVEAIWKVFEAAKQMAIAA